MAGDGLDISYVHSAHECFLYSTEFGKSMYDRCHLNSQQQFILNIILIEKHKRLTEPSTIYQSTIHFTQDLEPLTLCASVEFGWGPELVTKPTHSTEKEKTIK